MLPFLSCFICTTFCDPFGCYVIIIIIILIIIIIMLAIIIIVVINTWVYSLLFALGAQIHVVGMRNH